MAIEKLEKTVDQHFPGLMVLTGRAGTGKSVAAAGLAYLTAKAGGRVLWIDPLTKSNQYCPSDTPDGLIEDWRPAAVFNLTPFVEKAKGCTLVVIDHISLDAEELVPMANEFAQQAQVRVLLVISEKAESRYQIAPAKTAGPKPRRP
jgi:hypothetical protein